MAEIRCSLCDWRGDVADLAFHKRIHHPNEPANATSRELAGEPTELERRMGASVPVAPSESQQALAEAIAVAEARQPIYVIRSSWSLAWRVALWLVLIQVAIFAAFILIIAVVAGVEGVQTD